MNEAVIIKINNYSTKFKMYFYPNLMMAISGLKELYLKEIREAPSFDFYNTYLSKDGKYGQVSYGLGKVEFRVGELKECQMN